MQEALVGAAGSGSAGGAGAGEMGAGLQMDDTGAVMEAEVLIRPEETEEEEDVEEEELDGAGGVNWPLLSELLLSLAGDDFFFTGFTLALLLLCCCCRHLARRFLNQTCGGRTGGEVRGQLTFDPSQDRGANRSLTRQEKKGRTEPLKSLTFKKRSCWRHI